METDVDRNWYVMLLKPESTDRKKHNYFLITVFIRKKFIQQPQFTFEFALMFRV